jgi:anti-sigma28 factor (negative regulator of flagellin synthesis)
MRPGRAQWHVTQIDQLRVSPRLWEIQQAGRALAQTIDARETKIIALREDVESGHYRIKTEQVAEKLMKDHLLASFAS